MPLISSAQRLIIFQMIWAHSLVLPWVHVLPVITFDPQLPVLYFEILDQQLENTKVIAQQLRTYFGRHSLANVNVRLFEIRKQAEVHLLSTFRNLDEKNSLLAVSNSVEIPVEHFPISLNLKSVSNLHGRWPFLLWLLRYTVDQIVCQSRLLAVFG